MTFPYVALKPPFKEVPVKSRRVETEPLLLVLLVLIVVSSSFRSPEATVHTLIRPFFRQKCFRSLAAAVAAGTRERPRSSQQHWHREPTHTHRHTLLHHIPVEGGGYRHKQIQPNIYHPTQSIRLSSCKYWELHRGGGLWLNCHQLLTITSLLQRKIRFG